MHEPEAGETEAGNGTALSRAHAMEKIPDGFTYLDPARFLALFAADRAKSQAALKSYAQIATAAAVFTTKITAPAYRVKPSWALVAGADEITSPDLERSYAASIKQAAR